MVLIEQLTGININQKYQEKDKTIYVDYLIDPSFQGVNRFFVSSFEDKAHKIRNTGCFIPTVEIKDYDFMLDGKSFLVQPVKNDLRTYNNILKIATGQGDDYTTGCLINYPYFKDH